MNWHNIREWGIEGKGWTDTERYYDRLPARARASVPEAVWDLSHSATGMATLFESDAAEIWGRWAMESEEYNEPNFPAAGFSGLDLYTWTKKGWRWVGAGHEVKGAKHEQAIAREMTPKRRKYLLYLPLRNPVESVEIGVPDGASFTPITRKQKPVVFYGTSIVHGAYASRPGTIHTAVLGRWLNRPTLNLGFSGNARMEPALAELLAELEAKVYVLDCVPNMSADHVRERVIPFVQHLRKARPKTPIVLVGERPYTNSWIRHALLRDEKERAREYLRAFKKLQAAGIKDLHYIDGTNLFGDDNEAAPDGSHPTDLGYRRMAEVMYPVLKKIA
ncbi:lysophospholiPASe L1 [Terrimicrobium sacchariphilum]|uniref:LysophospholiPASe L1 n=1 Tax=Terrimicrobium sacchariphilum TaxID=690879 RepID=A0A146G6R0_TERSA|nr:SGNH/GDSL hydrolase family protein [Terrimicrobium sacchariphilum]GAT33072.1 lysophospholiPASe L1 [Terrimicrobium sacchariphilum]